MTLYHEVMLTAMKKLLAYYEGSKSDVGIACPICIVDTQLCEFEAGVKKSGCKFCPWIIYSGKRCPAMSYSLKRDRKPRWVAWRIKTLREQIADYERRLANEIR